MEESRSASLLDADYDLSVAREMQQLEIMMAAQEQERQRNQEPEPVVMEDPVWGKFTAPPAGFKPHQVTPFPLCCFRFAAGPERAAASPSRYCVYPCVRVSLARTAATTAKQSTKPCLAPLVSSCLCCSLRWSLRRYVSRAWHQLAYVRTLCSSPRVS